MNTKGYRGAIQKTATVKTNDPDKPQFVLRIKGMVKAHIFISSRYIFLRGSEGQSVTRAAEIRAESDKPLELTPADFNLEGKLEYTIEEVEKGRRYKLQFKSIPGPGQSYSGTLKLKTNYPEKPEITFIIRGIFKKQAKK